MRLRTVMFGWHWMLVLVCLGGCSPDKRDPGPAPEDSEPIDETDPVELFYPSAVRVTVTLDGKPAPDATVFQGGVETEWTLDANGFLKLPLDTDITGGSLYVIAAHPDARGLYGEVEPGEEEVQDVEVRLKRFDTSDNPAYVYQDAGGPDDRAHTGKCAHCHVTITNDWYESAHRTSASNPVVQAAYAMAKAELGVGQTGCADCHAPGIDGVRGGRELDEATGLALEDGVHCDVCHKVESVDLNGAPGVAGALGVVRPSEPDPFMGFMPLYFGPYADIGNAFMGSARRDHFRNGALCAGCHQHDQPVLLGTIDSTRWPGGVLPIQSTWEEWTSSAWSPGSPCQDCHMPVADVANSADLQMWGNQGSGAGGWHRAAGEVRHHSFDGPRGADLDLVRSAATVSIITSVGAGEVEASVTVRNVGAGHGLPTGEPLRSMVLLVEATCGGVSLPAVGGDAVPDFGGALDRKDSGADWSMWPGAAVGDVVRVVRQTGAWHDYTGFGPFGDGTFDAAAKGMPVEEVVGASVITAMNGDVATFDAPLPAGDVAYRGGRWCPSCGR